MTAIPKITRRFESSLASDLSAAGSSFTLEDATDDKGEALSGLYGVTVSIGGSNVEDMVVTISGNTGSIIYRGIDPDDPLTEVAANKKKHRRGDAVVITDYPILAYLRNILAGESGYTLPAMLRYASGVGDPSNADDLVRKAYVDMLVLGTLSTINVIVPGKAGETVANGNLLYFDETDNEWKKCDADTAATVNNTLLGIAQGAGTDGNAITNGVLLQGVDDAQSGLTEGDVQYASNTAGGISATPGTTEVTIGIAKSATELYFNPRFNQQLTEDQQDALAGTSGSPSSSNKFVTADDVAENTNSKIVRRKSDGNVTVPATPTASTDAASKSFVEGFIPSQNNYPNVNGSFSSYFAQVMPVDADLGWTVVGTPSNRANSIFVDGNSQARVFIALGGRPTSAGNTLIWNSGIDLKLAYLFTPVSVSQGTTPFAGTDRWFFHGFNQETEAASVPADITGVTARVGFSHYDGRIYAITANGTSVTATDIQADSVAKRHFTISVTPSSVLFYINGTLVATHTTNIPSGSEIIGAFFGGSDSNGTPGSFEMSSTIIISETLS